MARYGTLQLKALGTLADGTQTDVTTQVAWTSEVPSAVAVSSTGALPHDRPRHRHPGSTGLSTNFSSPLPAGSFVLVVATSQSGVPTNIRDGGGNTYQVLTTVSGGGTHTTLAVCTSTTASSAGVSCSFPSLPANSFAFVDAIELLGGLTGVDVVQNGVFAAITNPVSPTLRTTHGLRAGDYVLGGFYATAAPYNCVACSLY